MPSGFPVMILTSPSIIEGGVTGNTVIFYIGSYVADQTASWQGGTNVRVNLTGTTYRTVIFNSNGGTGSMSNQVANIPTALTSNAFTRVGYTFNNWNTAANGSGVSYANGATYSFAADVTLYAQWTANPTHTVTYANGGGTGTLPTQSPVSEGASFTVASGATLTRAGFTFAGWHDGTNPYAAGASYTMGTSNVTLTAQWTANPTHTVTYANGGGTGTLPTQSPVSEGASFTVASGATLTRAGFTFAGWHDGTNPYAAGASYTMGTSNVTLTAQWTANPTHTVTYANGGGTGTLPTQSPVSEGASFTVASGATLTRAGFTFAGWHDGTNPYAAGASYTMGTSNVTLTAQWTANPTHTVTYANGGGTGTLPTQSPVSEGASFTVASGATLTRAGFTFAGWHDGTNPYAAGASYTMGTSNVTLTAQWTANPTHTVTYANGGGTGTLPTQSPVSEGASFTVASGATLTRAGFTFAGWHDGTNPYAAGASYTMGTSNVTLTAQWTANPTHTVTYANGGGTGTLPTQSPVSEGASFTVASGATLTRAGFTFAGWHDGTNPYAAGASYTMGTSNVTLTAQWTPLDSYTVTFNANGGTGTMAPQVSNVAANLTLNSFTRAGYTFNGWNTNADGTSGTNYADGASYPFTANVTLYAKWTALPSYTVTFNANGGTGTMAPQVSNVAANLTLNSFTRTGYTFNGWNTNADGTSGTNYADGASYPFTANVTLYAKWTALPSYTVTFNANGGTGTMAPQVSNVAANLTLNSFTRTGYTFNGWNTNADGTSGTNYADGASYPFTANVTLYAKWTALPSYTVTFNANGGTGTMAPQVSNVAANLTLNSFTRTGYTFNGWNTNADGTSGTNYADGASYPFTANVTLYAKWTANPTHTVTLRQRWRHGHTAHSEPSLRRSELHRGIGRDPHASWFHALPAGMTAPTRMRRVPATPWVPAM